MHFAEPELTHYSGGDGGHDATALGTRGERPIVIAGALAARAELTALGDRDLLDLGRNGQIRIVGAASAVVEIEAKR